MLKLRKTRLEWHMARMGEMRNAYEVLVGKHKGRDHSEYLGVDRKIILDRILQKWGGKLWTGCI
jgi:hypothetical protein